MEVFNKSLASKLSQQISGKLEKRKTGPLGPDNSCETMQLVTLGS